MAGSGKPVIGSFTRYLLTFVVGLAVGGLAGAYFGPRFEQRIPELKPTTSVRPPPTKQATPPPAPTGSTGNTGATGPIGAETPSGAPK